MPSFYMAYMARIRPAAAIVALAMVLAACGAPAQHSDETDIRLLTRQSLERAEEYFVVTAFRDKGLFRYSYDPVKDSYTSRNNELRQLMGARLLAELAAGDPALLAKHRTNLGFLLEHWYREEGGHGYIFYDNKSKLGANAMALRTLVYSPDYPEHRHQAEMLAKGVLALQNPDGSLRPWLIEPDYEFDPDYLMTFYSGEAILALVEYAEKAGDAAVLESARRAQDFYLDRYVVHIKDNYYPAYVPWHTQSLSRLYRLTGELRYAEAILTLNDELLKIQDTTEHVGRFHDPDKPEFGSPHASSDAVYTEGLAYAVEIARDLGDEQRAGRYLRALEAGLRHLSSLQYTESNTGGRAQRARMLGGLRVSESNPNIRIDSVQHAIDAFIKALKVL